MTEKEPLSTRLPQDTFEEFEEYRKANNLGKSDAGRRLIMAGIEAERSRSEGGEDTPEIQSYVDNLLSTALYTGLMAILAGVMALTTVGTTTFDLFALVAVCATGSLLLLAKLIGKFEALGTITITAWSWFRGTPREAV